MRLMRLLTVDYTGLSHFSGKVRVSDQRKGSEGDEGNQSAQDRVGF
jgi:hypothetical protein